MPQILLSTLNARYIHASLGLRYLLANMGDLQANTEILEFTIRQSPEVMAEKILEQNPAIVGLGVYIWNASETLQLLAILKTLRPDLPVVLGGPEVSYEYESQPLVELADYLITGQADLAFARLCRKILAGRPPTAKIIKANPEPPAFLEFPYQHYSDTDIRQRVLYVEASRGCPFKCEFCLSALDKTATPFDIDAFLSEMQALFDRGASHFKFVDRTFNLKTRNSLRILEFFLEKIQERDLFLHFELIPDRLPDALKNTLTKFPHGSLQFEIGVQTFNPDVQDKISRRQDNQKTAENLRWLRDNTHAHIHADLIFGLPGESEESFAAGFDRLVQLKPHEIQLGILKRLRGTPIIRHTASHDMRFNPLPPYTILANDEVDFTAMQAFSRLARYWDLIANSGRFQCTLPLILGKKPFERFRQLSHAVYAYSGQTHKIALRRLFDCLYLAMTRELDIPESEALSALQSDFAACGHRDRFKPPQISQRAPADAVYADGLNHGSRQQRHSRQA